MNEALWFEARQLPAFRGEDFAVGLSENAPRSTGATTPDASIEANRSA
jgi:hypothetical protein